MAEVELPRISFTSEFKKILKELENENNYVAFELLYLIDPVAKYFNGLRITRVDISKVDWCFNITTSNGVKNDMKIGKFIRYFFQNVLSDQEITKFSKLYNSSKNGVDNEDGTYIKVPEFVYNPKDPRSTFLSLVTKTYPHGNEEEVLQFLPELSKDKVGNYYKIIGDSNTMFTAHLDTADRAQKTTTLFSLIKEDEEYIYTDGNSILGADDKAGITVMLYMMAHNIPGLYYFFIGEERGGIGSHALANIFNDVEYLQKIKKCVSFDRRNYHSIITEQMCMQCCSDEFGTALADEYNKNGLDFSLDPGGVYTDSASFIDDIPECTNVSIGYFDEHTHDECQNMTFLDLLCKASVKVEWETLPIKRKVGIDDEILSRNKILIDDMKNALFSLDTKLVTINNKTYFKFELEDSYIDDVHHCLILLSNVFTKHKIDPDIIIDYTQLKIELR